MYVLESKKLYLIIFNSTSLPSQLLSWDTFGLDEINTLEFIHSQPDCNYSFPRFKQSEVYEKWLIIQKLLTIFKSSYLVVLDFFSFFRHIMHITLLFMTNLIQIEIKIMHDQFKQVKQESKHPSSYKQCNAWICEQEITSS